MTNRRQKAFTIIELIVVIAIIGILVLFASPKLTSYVNQARLVRIQHDTRIMEDAMEEEFQHGVVQQWKSWDTNYKNLFNTVVRKQLFEAEGVADRVDMSYMRYQPFIVANPGINPKVIVSAVDGELNVEQLLAQKINLEVNLGGPMVQDDNDNENVDIIRENPHIDYRIIPTSFKEAINTRLEGDFYVNVLGKVYYEPDKPLTINEDNEEPNCPTTLDYEFEYLTGAIVKYTGKTLHLTIPSTFLVEGKCWPVKIIEKDAFAQGELKSVVIPSSVNKVENGAFKDNNLENDTIIIQRPADGVDINPEAFNNNGPNKDTPANPIYKPLYDNPIIRPNVDSNGNITGGIVMSGGSDDEGVIIIPPTVKINGQRFPVIEIADGAYQGLDLTTVILHEGLEKIGHYAFSGNQLIGVTIPNSVNYIGNYAFAFNEVQKVDKKIPGPDSMATIESIIMKDKEQLKNINKYGDIYKLGDKLNIMESYGKGPNIVLRDHIWLTSSGDMVIDKEYLKIEEPDLSGLLSKLEEAKKLKESDYESGWSELQLAIKQAENISDKSKPTQAEITFAIKDLDKAIAQLTKKPTEITTDGIYTFHGEVPASELINGPDLANTMKLKAGTDYNIDEPWLKFTKLTENGKLTTMYVAKKPLKHTLSWGTLNRADIVYGTKTVDIKGLTYKVRLMKGANIDPIVGINSDYHGSEWNRMMLPIHENAINKNWKYPDNVGPNDTAEFAHELGTGISKRYNDEDLLTDTNDGSWTQETYHGSRVLRGGYGISSKGWNSESADDRSRGWRPVLELISD